ncbi:hypothetical protein CAEBREN_18372 [Caenorhabditis brenneri]|uniref:Uncharacterized protein n=1 Tax=Caenorhabditis brenneri TaxID=135651 RepID=G0NXE1_CAEBE|nr:hypothetical protein CAEBREN_18372 [Caenorhabditis brenneri]
MATTRSHSQQLPVDGTNDSTNVECKTCGKINLEGGINPPRMNISKYVCTTCKRQQWTTSDSERMWKYNEITVDGFIGKEEKATWFNNMKKEIGGPYSDSTFKRHFKKEMMDYVSDGTKDLKKRIKYATWLRISCPLEVVNEFKRHGDVALREERFSHSSKMEAHQNQKGRRTSTHEESKSGYFTNTRCNNNLRLEIVKDLEILPIFE